MRDSCAGGGIVGVSGSCSGGGVTMVASSVTRVGDLTYKKLLQHKRELLGKVQNERRLPRGEIGI